MSAYQAAAQLENAYPRHALLAAQNWAKLAHHNNQLSYALDGYRIALNLLPKVAWLGLSVASRQDRLIREGSEELSCLSATCAIQLGHLEEAVELLDLGRSVFWQQASSLRADMEVLKEVAPGLADEFEVVGQKLDTGNFSGTLDTGVNNEIGRPHRRLVGEWEGLLNRVRQLPSFEHFLRPAPFCQLRQAITTGHVIIVNTSQYGVDALTFGAANKIEHVPLPNADIDSLSELASNIILHRPTNATERQQRSCTNRFLKPALHTVWNDVLIPIFNQIQVPVDGRSKPPQRRIWWYPTGPLTFIPIHAAGPGKGDIDVSHLIISSYMTTLGSLFQASKKRAQGGVGRLKLLTVSQPDTPGQGPLPLSTEETDHVVKVVHSAGWSDEDIVQLNGTDATVDRVSDELDSSSWVHFACHGIQHPTLGMKCAFALHNGYLELSQIASKRLSIGEFAFLSVCHGAAGLEDLPGEAMHLAGALQFAGIPSVAATMWAVGDKDALAVAGYTYRYIFRNGLQGCDPAEAATALNHAVLCLRQDPGVTVDRWAPFIHFGI